VKFELKFKLTILVPFWKFRDWCLLIDVQIALGQNVSRIFTILEKETKK